MKIDWKILGIVILIAILIFSNTNICNNRIEDNSRDTISTITRTDTVVLKEYFTDTITVTKYDVKYDTVYLDSSKYVKSYTVVTDSLINIEIDAYAKSNVDSFVVRYTPKFPITITKFITNDTEIVLEEKKKVEVYAGIMLSGGTESFGFAPVVHFKTRRDHLITLGYDLARKEFAFGYGLKIRFKNKYKKLL
jgi:hypothetical protein